MDRLSWPADSFLEGARQGDLWVMTAAEESYMSTEDNSRKPEDSTVAIVIGMLIAVLASLYVLYISGTLGAW